jgi:hypothetical protein
MSPGGMLKPHRGVLILVLGICGFFCIIVAVVALIMGGKDLKEMDAGVMDPSGRGLTQAGRILGLVFTVLGAIGLLISLASIILGLGAAATAGAGGP